MQFQIFKVKVDNFQPGKMIPSCQLNARITTSYNSAEISSLKYCVKLLGAKEPYDMFNIIPSTTATTSAERRGMYNDTYRKFRC